MRYIREAIRLSMTTNMSFREIERLINNKISRNTVKKHKMIIDNARVNWETIEAMDDSQLETLLKMRRQRLTTKRIPDWTAISMELQLPHVTRQLLWEEYCLVDPSTAISYSHFANLLREYLATCRLSMRQTHKAGEKVFVDFAGSTIPYNNPDTGEKYRAQIFVGTLGCSNYTFVYAVESQSLENWILLHNKMFEYFGGTPQIIVPDNLKAAVIKAGSIPELNRTYLNLGKHYRGVIIPARVGKAQDKGKVEFSVRFASRWILAALRHRQFFSIKEINDAIAVELKKLNERPLKDFPASRRERFEQLDKPHMRSLPDSPFEFAEWTSQVKVGPDYHVKVKSHYYSVPYSLVGLYVESRITAKVVEIYSRGKRVACHIRSEEVGGHTTIPAHQPDNHRFYADQTPEKILAWAKNIGGACYAVIKHQFDSRTHPILGIKACGTLQKLAKEYGDNKFELACERALAIGSPTAKSIRSILKRKLAEVKNYQMPVQESLPFHQNLRGSNYYSDRSK